MSEPTRIFVGNLSWDATLDEFRSMLEPFGTVSSLFLAADPDRPGRTRGFGFATYATPIEAETAIRMLNGNPDPIYGRALRVRIAEASPHGSAPGSNA